MKKAYLIHLQYDVWSSQCWFLGEDSPEAALRTREFQAAMNRFLGGLPEKERKIFVSRYWYLRSIREISEKCGLSESDIKTRLFRTRGKLRTFLAEEDLM